MALFLSLVMIATTVAVYGQSQPTVTPSATPSVGSSPSPSPSPRPLPIGTIREIASLDCNGGIHMLSGHPLEWNANVRGNVMAWNIMMNQVAAKAQCGAAGKCDLSQADIERHFVPGIPMMLNYYSQPYLKKTLPAACQTLPTTQDGVHPVFPQTFWDDSMWSTLVLPYFNYTRIMPQYINFPETCTYETYVGGLGCRMTFDEPVSGTVFQLGIDKCPGSYLPYASLTCKGPWCETIGRPCEPDMAGINQCGTSGLQCRSTERQEGSEQNDQLLGWMKRWGLMGNLGPELAECLKPGIGNARSSIYVAVRDKIMSWWGVNATAPVRDAPDLSFCLPSDFTYDAILDVIDVAFEDKISFPLDADANKCRDSESKCDVSAIGNGKCDISCFNAQCKWDGGDCGGPARAKGNTNPGQVADKNYPDTCRVKYNKDTMEPYEFELNYWEPCNGVGRCRNIDGTCDDCGGCQKFIPNPPSDPLPQPDPGVNQGLGAQCENCQAPDMCRAGCLYSAAGLKGISDRMDAWDGLLWDGTNVLDFDRKTGINKTTPSAVFEWDGSVGSNVRPILQTTCAGEVGVSVLNGFLQAGFHIPWLQDAVSTVTTLAQNLAQCRNAAIQTVVLGYTTVIPLSGAQLDFRFAPHSIGMWLYSLTHFGSGQFGDTNANTLYQKYSDPKDPRNFGLYIMQDYLNATGMAREPSPSPSPTGNPTPTPTFLQDSDWAKKVRYFAPSDGNCDFASGTDRTDPATDGGSRRCRFKYDGLGKLFQDKSNPPADMLHRLHFDIRMDGVCEGSPTGHKFPNMAQPSNPWLAPSPAPTLSPQAAKRALPLISIAYEGMATYLLTQPRPCAVAGSLECQSAFGNSGAQCVDVDNLLGYTRYFNVKGRNVDPFAQYVFGQYNADQGPGSCSSTVSLRQSIRQILLALGGLPADTETDPTFCMMNPNLVGGNGSGWTNWQATAADKGTCTSYNDDPAFPDDRAKRVCLRMDPVTTVRPSALPSSFPVRLNYINGPDRDFVVRQWGMGISPFTPNTRSTGTFPGGATRNLAVSMPVWTTAAFTNRIKEKLRWALAFALNSYLIGVSPDNVLITSVVDNGNSFAPLPDGTRAGVTVFFTLDVSNQNLAANITNQLQSSVGGALGGQAGAVFASLGMVPYRYQREVVFREVFPMKKGLTPGEIFGIVFAVGLFLGCIWCAIARYKGYAMCPCMPSRTAAAPRKDHTMGGVVEKVTGPGALTASASSSSAGPSTAPTSSLNPLAALAVINADAAAAAEAAASAPATGTGGIPIILTQHTPSAATLEGRAAAVSSLQALQASGTTPAPPAANFANLNALRGGAGVGATGVQPSAVPLPTSWASPPPAQSVAPPGADAVVDSYNQQGQYGAQAPYSAQPVPVSAAVPYPAGPYGAPTPPYPAGPYGAPTPPYPAGPYGAQSAYPPS